MTIAELIQSPESPLNDEQKRELDEDYTRLLTSIKEMGEHLEKANANSFTAKKDAKNEEERKKKAIDIGIGCLNAVKAMLSIGGGTHRQRDFYASAIVKFIENAISDMEGEKEPYPF